MDGYTTQSERHGATQGPTQDTQQYPDEPPTSTAPVEPGEPKDPGHGGDPVHPPDPEVVPSSTPQGPSTIPAPQHPDANPDPQTTQTQLENAETSLDEPSDGSGGE